MIFFLVHQGQKLNLYQAGDTLSSMRNTYAVSAAINFVHLAGEGTNYNFTLTGKNRNENITLTGFSVESRRAHAVSQSPLLNADTNQTSLQGGRMVIKNIEGAIEIE